MIMASEIRITRRKFVVASGAFLALPTLRLTAEDPNDAIAIAENAYIWGFPPRGTSSF